MSNQALLSILRANARTPVSVIASELSLSEEQVVEQIAQLEKDGVLIGYQAVIDTTSAASATVSALIEVKITPERGGGFDRLAQRIAKFEQVQGCYLMSGGYDLLVIVEGTNLQQVAAFVSEKLSTIPGVISTATHFRLKAYKESGLILHREPDPVRLAITP